MKKKIGNEEMEHYSKGRRKVVNLLTIVCGGELLRIQALGQKRPPFTFSFVVLHHSKLELCDNRGYQI